MPSMFPVTPEPEQPVPVRPHFLESRIGRSLIRLTIFLVLTFALWWLVAGLMAPFAGALVTSAISLGATALGTTAVVMRIYERQPLSAVGLFWNRLGGTHLALGLGLGSGMSLLIAAIQWSSGWARLERGPLPPDAGLTIPFWVFVLAIGATGEELLFRGYAFQNLIRAFGPWFSVLSTSVLFGLGHSANPAFSRVSLLNTALFGILFGYAYWRTRDLWLPLGMHFAWNFTLAAIGANISGLKIKLMGLSMTSAGSPLWSGGDYGPEASLITTLVLTAAVIFLWKAPTARQENGLLAELP